MDRATEKGILSAPSLNPKARAVAVMAGMPASTPSWANTVLQEWTNASRTEASAQPLASFDRRVLVLGSR